MSSEDNPHQKGEVMSDEFAANLARIPAETYAQYRGQYVALARDGTKILAAGKTFDELFENADRMGLKPSDYIGQYICPDPDAIHF